MNKKTKHRFTAKIMLSYLLLCSLAVVSSYFIYSEIQEFIATDSATETDIKLLKTGSLVTQLYEAESLSKLALQSKTQANFNAYAQKIDSIFIVIDTLKHITESDYQRSLLDSVQMLLDQKRANNNELRTLKAKNEANNSIDNALKGFSQMEASLGKITPEGLAPNIEQLSPKAQTAIRNLAAVLNANIPKDTTNVPDAKKIDSILNFSKALLAEAKKSDAKTQRFLALKEREINRNDLELSQKLRTILSLFEQEVMVNTYNDNIKRKTAMRRSMRLAGIAALLGFVVVGIFTFLINRDFWKAQMYRLKLEKEKKYSESLLKSREQLISTVSHDLRTPLNTITGYTELMENSGISDKQERYLKNIRSASEYVGNLVNDLLDFSKLEAGKLNIEKVPFVPSHLLQETIENVEALYLHKTLELVILIDPVLDGTVLGDPFRIRQIFTNLLGNAFKFTERGSITVKVNAVNHSEKQFTMKIDVLDTGIGIAKEKQHLIFKEFTQAESTTERKFGGYGLGLTISKKLAELLKGKLFLESKEGHGSTFTLQIPLEISTKPIVSKVEEAFVSPKLSMLIIDDDTALLGMLKELAESMGITAHAFPNFLNIKKESHLQYDLVLTDIQMPQINGFEVLKKLRSGEYVHYRDQPIIAMTGKRDLDATAFLALGFTQVLQKPFSKGELIGMLNMLGITTKQHVSDRPREKERIVRESHLYDLEIIHSFLGENEEAIHEVLQTFLNETHDNMRQLEISSNLGDYTQVNQTAHKMLPMFRQLKVESTVPVLEKLEIVNASLMNKGQLLDSFRNVKKEVSELIRALENRLAISPTYNG